MATIVGKKCQIILQRGRGNQEVHIANHGANSAKSTTLSAKKARHFLIQPYDIDAVQKIIEFSLAFLRITGIVYTLVKLGECHHSWSADSEARSKRSTR